MNTLVRNFLAADRFAVVGASKNPSKFGNKVLQCYLWREKAVVPVNPREDEIEGQKCAKSLTDLQEPHEEVSVSVVTPPAITLGVVEEAGRLGIKRLWLQPGSENEEVLSRAQELGLSIIHGEPCVLVELGYYAPDLVAGRRSSPKIPPQRDFSQALLGGDDTSGGSSALRQQEKQEKRQQVFSFDAPDGPSAPGVGHGHDHHEQQQLKQRERRPSCEESDDPEYSCLVPRPPGSFADELRVYFSLTEGTSEGGHNKQHQQQSLSVKVVVPAVTWKGQGGGGRGEARWASLGFSPNGKMAGPSEAVVGFAGTGAAERDDQGVFRYRMDGYSIAAVSRLPDRHQVLTEQAVETTAEGSLVVRFKRPLVEGTSRDEDVCACEAVAAEEREARGAAATTATDAGDVASAEMNVCLAALDARLEWLNPRDNGMVLLWAYGRGAWPSYHDATGAFVLPRLTPEG
eukprot:g12298.t1